MDWLAYKLSQLTGRERLLVFAMFGLALPVAFVFFAAIPILEARASARSAAIEAEALRDWVAAHVADLPPEGLSNAPETAPPPDPIGLSGLEQSLVAASLRGNVAQLANRPDGGVDLQFDDVAFDALIAWLHNTTRNWGYDVSAFRIERADPGLAAASFTLEPAQ